MMIIVLWVENIFIGSGALTVFVEVLSNTITIAGINTMFLFVFIFSLGAREAVYINNVIIPDENVMIITKGSHLDIVSLKILSVIIMETVKRDAAIKIGFLVFVIFIIVKRAIRVAISNFILLIYKINVLFLTF